MQLDFSTIKDIRSNIIPLLIQNVKCNFYIVRPDRNELPDFLLNEPQVFIEDPTLSFNMIAASISKNPRILSGFFTHDFDFSPVFSFISENYDMLIDLWNETDIYKFLNKAHFQVLKLSNVFQNENGDEELVELIISSNKSDNGKHEIYSMTGNFSEIFPFVPPVNFCGSPSHWREIVRHIPKEYRIMLIYDTIGFHPISWNISMERAIELGYKISV